MNSNVCQASRAWYLWSGIQEATGAWAVSICSLECYGLSGPLNSLNSAPTVAFLTASGIRIGFRDVIAACGQQGARVFSGLLGLDKQDAEKHAKEVTLTLELNMKSIAFSQPYSPTPACI